MFNPRKALTVAELVLSLSILVAVAVFLVPHLRSFQALGNYNTKPHYIGTQEFDAWSVPNVTPHNYSTASDTMLKSVNFVKNFVQD